LPEEDISSGKGLLARSLVSQASQETGYGNVLVQRIPMQAAAAHAYMLTLFLGSMQEPGKPGSGTPMILPSLKSTHMLSGSKCTRVALAEEFIPCSLDAVFVEFNNLQQLAENAGLITVIVRYANFRLQPEFRFHIVFLDMNVDRLAWHAFVQNRRKI